MFIQRLRVLKQKLLKEKMDAVFISSVSNITYLTGYTNFSHHEREAYLLVGQDFQYIITDARYSEAVKLQVSHITLFERGHKSSIDDLLKSLKDKINNLAIEEDNLTVAEYRLLRKHVKKIKHLNVNQHRSVKNLAEISKIKKACQIGDLAFKNILKKIQIGVTEKHIAEELEKFIKQKGAEFSFPPIVAFGKNSSIPHHQTGITKLDKKDGEFVLLDFGVNFENYCSDMTRTIFFGKPSRKQEEIYETVSKAQQMAVEFINNSLKKGKKIITSQVDQVAREYIISKGYSTIPHSLGHGIGLEVHEHPYLSPKSKEKLKEGMVFSIEPGIYLEGFGGVRVEDLFVIKDKKLLQLTTSKKELLKL